MLLKKCNAVLALAAALLLAIHNALNARMMILGRVNESPSLPAYILIGLLFLHIPISLFVLLKRNDGRGVRYTNISMGWLFQRVTGIALIPLILFHGFIRAGQFGIGLPAILVAHFFIMLLAYLHIPLSVPNALLTLGLIDTDAAYRTAHRVCRVVCALLFLAGLTASLWEVLVL